MTEDGIVRTMGGTQYVYLLLTVFDRPSAEVMSVKYPKSIMNLKIWEHLTNEQFDYLYGILNTKSLDQDIRYTIFHNSIIRYNSVLVNSLRLKRVRAYDKVYREANKEKRFEYNRKWRANNKDKIAEQDRRYRAKNKDKIKQRAEEYRRNKNA